MDRHTGPTMLIHAATTALTLLLAAQDAPVDREKQILTDLSARARQMCETRPRPAGEDLEACVQRRTTALLATHGTPAAALAAAGGPTGAGGLGNLGFATLTRSIEPANNESTAAEPAREASPVRCRQETTRSQDGTSVSTSLICGNGGETEQRVREMLDETLDDD